MTPQGWRPEFTATFARATASLRDYMRCHSNPCVYCGGTGTVLERAGFRGGRLFPVACEWCKGTGRQP